MSKFKVKALDLKFDLALDQSGAEICMTFTKFHLRYHLNIFV